MFLEKVFYILIQTDFEQGFLEEGAFDRLVQLVVEVLANDFCEIRLALVRIVIFLLFVHYLNNISVNFNLYVRNVNRLA